MVSFVSVKFVGVVKSSIFRQAFQWLLSEKPRQQGYLWLVRFDEVPSGFSALNSPCLGCPEELPDRAPSMRASPGMRAACHSKECGKLAHWSSMPVRRACRWYMAHWQARRFEYLASVPKFERAARFERATYRHTGKLSVMRHSASAR
jgi:hypothetical protein